MLQTSLSEHAVAPDALLRPMLEAKWYACYTRGHHEKRVAEHLRQRRIESFLPTHSRVRRWTDRTKRVALPLFPSYVFARFHTTELPRVLDVDGVVTIVRAGSTLLAISDEDIDNVRRFAAAAEQYAIAHSIEPYVNVGEQVRIIDGPLRGVEGLVLEWRHGHTRVLIGLQAVGQGLSVNVSTASLQRIEPRR